MEQQSQQMPVHTAQSEAEAVSNHSLRAVWGEKPNNKAVEALKEKQAAIATSLPNDKARAVTQAL